MSARRRLPLALAHRASLPLPQFLASGGHPRADALRGRAATAWSGERRAQRPTGRPGRPSRGGGGGDDDHDGDDALASCHAFTPTLTSSRLASTARSTPRRRQAGARDSHRQATTAPTAPTAPTPDWRCRLPSASAAANSHRRHRRQSSRCRARLSTTTRTTRSSRSPRARHCHRHSCSRPRFVTSTLSLSTRANRALSYLSDRFPRGAPIRLALRASTPRSSRVNRTKAERARGKRSGTSYLNARGTLPV